MTNKQNALEIIRFGQPQRIFSWVPCHTLCYHGCNHEGYAGGGHHLPVGSTWADIWGTRWEREHEGVMGFPKGNPLDEPGKLRGYQWPSPDDERICGAIYQQGEKFAAGDLFLAGAHRDTLWEKAYMLVGMENMMCYFHTEPAFAREVLHRIMDFQLGMAKHYLAAGIELANCGDDLGTQLGPLLGPQIVDEFLVPEYRRLFSLYKSQGKLINFHSCGQVNSILEPLMQMGIDVLNPVQASANDLDEIRRQTQGRMALCGGVGTDVIIAGPVERIIAETRRRLWQLGQHGGYFCAPDQGMPFPPGHLEAVLETVEKFGGYPLSETAA